MFYHNWAISHALIGRKLMFDKSTGHRNEVIVARVFFLSFSRGDYPRISTEVDSKSVNAMVKNKTIFHGLYSYRPKKWRQSVKTLQWNHYMYLRLPFPVRGREVSHLLGWSPSICTKYTVTLIFKGSSILPRNSAPCSCSFCIANCIYRRFLITQFLAIKLWARIHLQIRDKSSPLFLYLYVTFDQQFVQRVLWSRLTLNLQILN